MQRVLSVADFNLFVSQNPPPVPFPAADDVIISDTALNLFSLDATAIIRMGAFNVDTIECSDNTHAFVWGVAQAQAIAITNIKFNPIDNVQLFDSPDNLLQVDAIELAKLAEKGLDSIQSKISLNQEAKQTYDVARFHALGNIALSSADKIYVTDTALNLGTLTPTELQKLATSGTSGKLKATDNTNPVLLSASQLVSLSAANFELGTVPVMRDTAENLQLIDPNWFGGFADKGVIRIEAIGDSWSISAAQASALLNTGMALKASDTVTLVGTAGDLQTVTTRIGELADRGVDQIDVSGNDTLILSAATAATLAGTLVKFTAGDQVTVAGLGVDLAGLGPNQIARLGAARVKMIDVGGDNKLTLSVDQAIALAGTGIVFASDDRVTILGRTTDLNRLSVADLRELGAKGAITLDSDAPDNFLFLSVDKFKVLGGITLETADAVQVVGTGAEFAALDASYFAKLASKNVDSIGVTDGNVSLSLEKITALGTVALRPEDTVTLLDDAGVLQGLRVDATHNDIQALADKGIDRIESNAVDHAWTMSMAQAGALLNTSIVLNGNDTVTLATATGDLPGLTGIQIRNLAIQGVDVIHSTNAANTLSLSAVQAIALLATPGTPAIKLTQADTVTLSDTLTGVQALSAAQITGLATAGIDVIDATGTTAASPLVLAVDQAIALAGTQTMTLANGNQAVVTGAAAALQGLSGAQIKKLGEKGVDVIDATGVGALNLNFEQATGLAAALLRWAADDDVTVTMTLTDLKTLMGAQISALRAKGVDHFHVTNPGNELVSFTVAQLDALAGLDVTGLGNIILGDTGANIGSLAPGKIAQLASQGVVSIDASNDILVLSAAQLKALGTVGLTATDTITLLDTTAWLTELTAAQITALGAQGVDKINVLDDEWSLTIAQAKALAGTGISLVAADGITLTATAAELATLSANDIIALGKKNLDLIDVSGNNPFTLSAAQAVALAGTGSLKFADDDMVVVSADGATLAGLTVEQIAALSAKGVDILSASDNQLRLSVAQVNALGNIQCNNVTLSDTGANLAALTAAQIAALRTKGIYDLDASDGELSLSMAQVDALGALRLTGLDTVSLFETGTKLATLLSTLTADQIADLSAKGIDALNASDNQLSLSVAQFSALGNLGLTAADTVTLSDTGVKLANLLATLTPAALSAKGIDALDASDNQLSLSIAQVNALGNLGLTGDDWVTLSENGADLATLMTTLTAEQIVDLGAKGIDALDALDNQLSLSVAQYNKLGNLALTAGDTVTLSDTGANLAALTAAQILALKAKGVDAIDASDNSISLSLEQFNALGALNLASNDVIKVQGTGSADVFTGRGANQVFYGSGGNDVIKGGAGNETLSGGAGKDVLTGGAGKDVFVFDTAPSASNLDQITDFNVADDTIWLDNAVFKKLGSKGSALSPAKLNAKFFTIGSQATTKDHYLVYDKVKGILYYDADGSGAGKMVEIVKLAKNLKTMTAADFLIV